MIIVFLFGVFVGAGIIATLANNREDRMKKEYDERIQLLIRMRKQSATIAAESTTTISELKKA
jgi:hypothetical protein